MSETRIGTAGWSIPARDAREFPAEGSSLERYATRFDCAEINSTFHRPHRPATFERWAASVPDEFRFSAKLPKTITHQQRLVGAEILLEEFVEGLRGLGDKLTILLVQLPPSLAFDAVVARTFFQTLRGQSDARLACEPRHPSWFEAAADDLLVDHQVARVAADPAKVPEAAAPSGWRGFAYYRLHGSPILYRSSYEPERLRAYAEAVAADRRQGRDAWCIFDNTASSAATGNALEIQTMLGSAR